MSNTGSNEIEEETRLQGRRRLITPIRLVPHSRYFSRRISSAGVLE